MRIPQGTQFGSVVAEPQRRAQAPQDTAMGAALGQVGEAGMQLAGVLKQSEIVKQRAEAATTLASTNNDIHDIHDEISRAVGSGQMKPEDALEEFRTRVAEVKNSRTENLTADQRSAIDSHLINSTGTLERSLQGVIVKRNQSDVGASIQTMAEQFQRSAMRDLPGAVSQFDQVADAMGPHAGWDPAKITEVKQRFKEGAHFNFANATLEGAAQTGNVDLVRAARAKIEGPDGEAIDPAKRTTLITRAYAYENGILASNQRESERSAREQQARENDGVSAYNEAFDLMSKGRYFSQDYINELTARTSGTKVAPKVMELVKSQAQVAGFASLPLKKQEAELERMRAAGSDPKAGIDPMNQKVQEQLQRIHDESRKAYADNPWKAAQERGVIQDAPVITLNTVQDAQQVLATRMQQIGQVEVAAGRKVSPLQPDEARGIGRLVRALPPDQQSSALASFGALIRDPDRLTDFARQIDANDKVLGTAMMYANQQTTQGRYVSELVLRGARALKDKEITVDSHQETGWRGAIAKELGDAYPNQELRQRIIDAAYLVQASFMAEGQGTDISRAIRLTGGRIVERNGSKIPLPVGMEESDFEKRLKGIQPADLASQGGAVKVGTATVPLDQFVKQLPDARLEHAGQGRYAVKAGMGYALRPDGKPLIVDLIRRPQTVATSTQPAGMVESGNIDLNARPVVKNKDGSISTVRSMSVNFDGQEVLIPTVAADGSRILSDEEAIQQYRKTGQHLGKFKTPAQATAYAEALHKQQERRYAR